MAIRDSSVRDALVEGLTADVTKAEREASRMPPYPRRSARRGSGFFASSRIDCPRRETARSP